jgi:hypothetical protein
MARGIKGTIRRLNKEKLVIIFLFNERLITNILYLPKIRILISMVICCGPIWYPWWYFVVVFDIHGDMLWSYLISMVICCGPIWYPWWYVVVLFDIHGDMLWSYLISMVICCVLFYVLWFDVRDGYLLWWYWWNCWSSFSFHIQTLHLTLFQETITLINKSVLINNCYKKTKGPKHDNLREQVLSFTCLRVARVSIVVRAIQ